MVQYAPNGNTTMALTYTYWQEPSGWWLGYWNDYPDHMTQGHTLEELNQMLRSLRADIMAMIADGTLTEAPRSVGTMEYA